MSTATDGMMTLDVEGISKVGNAFAEFSELFGVPINYLAKDQLRLAVADLVKAPMPPSYAAGRAATRGDINRVFTAIDKPSIVASWDIKGGRAFRLESGGVFAVDNERLDESGSGMRERHRRYRSRATGRVAKGAGKPYKVGNMLYLSKSAVRGDALKSYTEERRKRVGMLRASWLPALVDIAAAIGKTTKVPAWVERAAARYGSASLHSMSARGDGYVSATNSAKHAAAKLASYIPSVMAKRSRDINNGMWREGRAQQIVDDFNRGRI